jgi:outer membrane murein-binding lipoprotein Lpp
MDLLSIVPFLATTTGGRHPQINMQKIFESLVIAGITAAITMYGTVNAMSTKMDRLEVAVATLAEKVAQAEIMRASLTAQRTLEISTLMKQNIDQEERIRKLEARQR